MFCSQCGTYNDKGATVCVKCGTKLGISQEEVQPTRDFPENTVFQTPAEPQISKNIEEPIAMEEVKEPELQPEEKVEPIKEYIMWSIISAILFSIPFGTAAVIFSGFTNTEYRSGNIEKAQIYSQKTKFFCKISTALACVKAAAALIVLLYFTPWASLLGNLFPF